MVVYRQTKIMILYIYVKDNPNTLKNNIDNIQNNINKENNDCVKIQIAIDPKITSLKGLFKGCEQITEAIINVDLVLLI